MQVFGNEILKGQKLTIGLDLGDRWSFYCVLDEAGKILVEQKVATTPEAMKQTFGKIPRSLIAMETGTHSPRVRMEGWRQRRPGSNAKESTGRKEKTERKNILTRKKKKNILDTHRPSHGRTWALSSLVWQFCQL